MLFLYHENMFLTTNKMNNMNRSKVCFFVRETLPTWISAERTAFIGDILLHGRDRSFIMSIYYKIAVRVHRFQVSRCSGIQG